MKTIWLSQRGTKIKISIAYLGTELSRLSVEMAATHIRQISKVEKIKGLMTSVGSAT